MNSKIHPRCLVSPGSHKLKKARQWETELAPALGAEFAGPRGKQYGQEVSTLSTPSVAHGFWSSSSDHVKEGPQPEAQFQYLGIYRWRGTFPLCTREQGESLCGCAPLWPSPIMSGRQYSLLLCDFFPRRWYQQITQPLPGCLKWEFKSTRFFF